METVSIATIMTKDTVTVALETPLAELVAKMCEARSRCAIVCENGEPVGVVSTTDLAQILSAQLNGDVDGTLTAMDVMGFPAFCVDESESMTDAMELISGGGFSRVAVVNERGALTGVVTLSDLLRAHARQLDERRESLELLVADRTSELVRANEALEQISLTDGLMGIGNRRAMSECLDQTHSLATRFGNTYSIIMCDIDWFKDYNDHYGHPEGDSVLRRVAEAMGSELREVDRLFRYGGEELLAMLTQTDHDDALDAAERLRAGVEALAIPHERSSYGVVTMSFGVARCHIDGRLAADSARVVIEADKALYRAKQAGRNHVSG